MAETADLRDAYAPIAPQGAPVFRTTLVVAVTALLAVGQLYATLSLTPQIGADLHTVAAVWVTTVFGFGYALGMLCAGTVSDVLGRRRVAVSGLLAAAIVTVLVAFAPTFAMLLIARTIQGLASAFFAPVALAYLGERLPIHHRTVALTTTMSAFLAAAILAPLAAAALTQFGGWHGWFLVSGLLLVCAAYAVARVWLPDGPVTEAVWPALGRRLARIPALAVQPRLRTLYVTTLALMFVFIALTTAVQLGQPGVRGNPAAMQVVRACTLPACVLVPLATPVLRRFAPVNRMLAGFLLLAAGTALAAAAANVTTVTVALAVVTAAVAVTTPAIVECIGGVAAVEQRGSATAIYGFALFSGASLGAPVATALIGTGVGFGPIVAGFALVALACAGLSLVVRRERA